MTYRHLAILAVLTLMVGSAVPVDAAGRGGGHRGGGQAVHPGGGFSHGGHRGHWHGGGRHGRWGGHHHHGGWWGGAFLGGFALGTALTYPWVYPYPAYAYAYPGYAYPYDPYAAPYFPYAHAAPGYPAYATETAATQPAVSYQQRPAVIQREVVYSHGKYVLHGDGVTRAWQWVWVPASSPGSAVAVVP